MDWLIGKGQRVSPPSALSKEEERRVGRWVERACVCVCVF